MTKACRGLRQNEGPCFGSDIHIVLSRRPFREDASCLGFSVKIAINLRCNARHSKDARSVCHVDQAKTPTTVLV